MQEKHDLEESLSRMLEERQFVERCLADARMEISRLEMESESTNSSVHQSQLAAAKTEGKLQAAQTRVSALEKELQKKKDEVIGLNDELKRARTNMMQSESEKVGMNTYACSKKAMSARSFVFRESKGDDLCVSQGLELNTLRNELQYLRTENDKMKLESQQWGARMEEVLQQHQKQLSQREQELNRIASEKLGLTGLLCLQYAARESIPTRANASGTWIWFGQNRLRLKKAH
jgi:chromosome segregation ATPase